MWRRKDRAPKVYVTLGCVLVGMVPLSNFTQDVYHDPVRVTPAVLSLITVGCCLLAVKFFFAFEEAFSTIYVLFMVEMLLSARSALLHDWFLAVFQFVTAMFLLWIVFSSIKEV